MRRIQRRRTKGWRMPEGAVYVGRPSRWGNPYVVGGIDPDPFVDEPMDARIAAGYFGWAVAPFKPEDWFAPLRGRDLVCWCPLDAPCHADVLLELANEGAP